MGFEFEDLGKFNVYIQTNLGYESENQGEYFWWKKQRQKISCKCTFKKPDAARRIKKKQN